MKFETKKLCPLLNEAHKECYSSYTISEMLEFCGNCFEKCEIFKNKYSPDFTFEKTSKSSPDFTSEKVSKSFPF